MIVVCFSETDIQKRVVSFDSCDSIWIQCGGNQQCDLYSHVCAIDGMGTGIIQFTCEMDYGR